MGSVQGKKTETLAELPVRIRQKVATGTPENLILIELPAPIKGLEPVKVRYSPIRKDEAVIGVGYTDNFLRVVDGRHALPEANNDPDGEPGEKMPFLLFELWERGGTDRTLFHEGASGSPIFDCDGNLVAVTTGFLSRMVSSFKNAGFAEIRFTTSWGEPNNLGVPAPVIEFE